MALARDPSPPYFTTDHGLRTTDAAKKERRGSGPRLFSMGNGQRIGRLRGLLLVAQLRRILLVLIRGKPVVLAKPAAQVDEPAAWTAKRKLRPFGCQLAGHHPLANRATYPKHRKLRSWTWAIFPCPWRRFRFFPWR